MGNNYHPEEVRTNYPVVETRIALVMKINTYQEVINLRRAIRNDYIAVDGEFVRCINQGYLYVLVAGLTERNNLSSTRAVENIARNKFGIGTRRKIVDKYSARSWFKTAIGDNVDYLFSAIDGGVFIAFDVEN